MNAANNTKSLTLRLPYDLYRSSQELAQEQHLSLNALIQKTLSAFIEAERQRKLFDEFTLLGEDAEGASVDYAFAAQREIVLADASPDKER